MGSFKCSVEGKIGQALEGVLLYIGPWGFYSTITSDHPTGLSGLMSRAVDKGKRKGKGIVALQTTTPKPHLFVNFGLSFLSLQWVNLNSPILLHIDNIAST